jgi:ribosome-binding ATPase
MLLGLVGKPSVGKSTFFKAATMAEVPIANYPFTTIDSNSGVGYVKIDCIDKEFNAQCNPNHGFCINHKRFVPVKITDVAGLVPGASEGKGLGNQFLDDLREADVFIYVVDVSGTTDEKGNQTENYDPSKDVEFLEKELDNWFFNLLNKSWKTLIRKSEVEDKKLSFLISQQLSGLKVKEMQVKKVILEMNLPEKGSLWTEEQLKNFISGLRKESKPMIIAANKIDLSNGQKNYENLKKEFRF